MNLDSIIFLISAVVAVFGATMMITQRNPVAAVLYLIVSLLAQAVLFVQLGALFMGAVLIVVYAGAIMILFLFVIMLLNLRGKEDLTGEGTPIGQISKYAISILIVAELVMVVKSVFSSNLFSNSVTTGVMAGPPDDFGSVEDVGMLLFQRYLYPFELTSVLLLTAIVGAVVMARQLRTDDVPEQEEGPSERSETGGSE